MISNNSTLFIHRFLVMKSGRAVYDEKFHLGINIIRGDNSIGKSTIMDLLFFGLGGDLREERWNKEAAACDSVVVQIEINGYVLTVSRAIEPASKPPMQFFSGDYESSQINHADWVQYGIMRTANKHSFSQQIFELFGWPHHQNDDSSNLTIHQILRLIYVDQDTPVNKILKAELAFDKPSMRQAIGDFLLGVDDLGTYGLRQQLSKAETDFSKIYGQLEAIFKYISPTEGVLRAEHLNNEIEEANQELNALLIERQQIALQPDTDSSPQIKEAAAKVAEQISTLAKEIDIRTSRRVELVNEIVESELFIKAIEFRLKSLQESRATYDLFGEVRFKFCPCCLSTIESHGTGTCHLCKTDVDDEKRKSSYLAALNDLNFQKRESESVLVELRTRLEEADRYIQVEGHQLNTLKSKHKAALTLSSDKVLKLYTLSSRIGTLEERVTNLKAKIKLVSSVEQLISDRDKLNNQILHLKDEIKKNAYLTESRKSRLESNLSERTITLLRQDGGFESDFIDPGKFEFDFARDYMLVDGRSKFSASSETIMKNSFHLAILQESIWDENMRYPRLLLMDNIEDKGMGPMRSQNFQRLLVRSLEGVEQKYQIIMTTSMIDPGLNESSYCVGPYYEKGMHTLQLSGGSGK
ncbi:AAA family ATPase [Pseudomonas sp. MAFF 302046]|uniref:AAA family ATPase n=1 Tax=Pseudomonas morbosilactucae TaxID=2938197 RepID=A0ABT0JQK9_9PSED|nr:AAA family ATPase [Pseudomonas morbosilactucae]MCK9818137.1 AAA family ATPase [Pseudomonas morbosilactucae]